MKTLSALLRLCTLALLATGCAALRGPTPIAIEKRLGSFNHSQAVADSVFIYLERLVDRTADTVLVREGSVERRFYTLHDSVLVWHRDSIPYEVRVTEVREVPRRRTWADMLAYACLGLTAARLGLRVARWFKRVYSSLLL